jgi:protein-disulfide isomerase-like protein with CxxC motif
MGQAVELVNNKQQLKQWQHVQCVAGERQGTAYVSRVLGDSAELVNSANPAQQLSYEPSYKPRLAAVTLVVRWR